MPNGCNQIKHTNTKLPPPPARTSQVHKRHHHARVLHLAGRLRAGPPAARAPAPDRAVAGQADARVHLARQRPGAVPVRRGVGHVARQRALGRAQAQHRPALGLQHLAHALQVRRRRGQVPRKVWHVPRRGFGVRHTRRWVPRQGQGRRGRRCRRRRQWVEAA